METKSDLFIAAQSFLSQAMVVALDNAVKGEGPGFSKDS